MKLNRDARVVAELGNASSSRGGAEITVILILVTTHHDFPGPRPPGPPARAGVATPRPGRRRLRVQGPGPCPSLSLSRPAFSLTSPPTLSVHVSTVTVSLPGLGRLLGVPGVAGNLTRRKQPP